MTYRTATRHANHRGTRVWSSHRGASPLGILLEVERLARHEAESHPDDLFALLARATPAQIKAASQGATGPAATAADISRAWTKLRLTLGNQKSKVP